MTSLRTPVKGFRTLAVIVVSVILVSTVQAQEPVPVGEDFQVNTTTTGAQGQPDIAQDSAGNSIVVWQDRSSNGGDVRGVLLDADGSSSGTDFVVNDVTAQRQEYPVVARSDEGFVVVWEGPSFDQYPEIEARRFQSDGTPIGSSLVVNTYTPYWQYAADVTMDSNGDFVVVWHSYGSYDVSAQSFTSNGSTVGGEFIVNSYRTGIQWAPAVDILNEAGDFMVVWEGQGTGDTNGIFGHRFSSDGTEIGDQFLVNDFPNNQQNQADLVADGTGGALVVWRSLSSPGDDNSASSIQGRRFASDGTAIGNQFQINSYTSGSQERPKIAKGAFGDFLVVWQGEASGETGGISGQFLDSTGAPQGGQFLVNTHTPGDQKYPAVAADAVGDFMVVWQSQSSAGTDSSAESIQARQIRITGEVGDFVWFDKNFNGIQDAGEEGLSGVDVEIFNDLSQSIASTTTDEDGAYLFNKIPPGDYFVRVTRPGLIFSPQDAEVDDDVDSDVDANGESGLFTVGTGATVGDIDAGGYFGPIGDRVWLDANADGIQDGNEAGMENVTVTLYDSGGAQVDQTQTDSDGLYFFNPDSGEYYLGFTAPAGHGFTTRDAGNDDSVDSDVSSEGFTAVFLLDGSSNHTRDAGLIPTTATIGDRVWMDDDLDGVQDGGEAGVEGVVVELFTFAGVSQGTIVTGADGSYAFPDLPEGSYYLAFTAPTGFCFTAQDQGADDTRDSDADPLTGATGEIVLVAGMDDLSWDAGLAPDASVGNRVWLDSDGNGLQNGGETGVEGVTVRLYNELDVQQDEMQTDSTGGYAFSPGPGDYYLEFLLPADTAFAPRDQGTDDAIDSDVFASTGTTPIFTLGPAQIDASRDAGIEPATIGNRVWLDTNEDGRQQPSEVGVEGVTVRLLDASDSEIASMVTDVDGVYGFLGIATGEYRVEVVLPAGANFSPQDIGGDELIDSDVDPATGRTVLFNYEAGGASRFHDAGLVVDLLPIFSDGFESGTTAAWSSVVP